MSIPFKLYYLVPQSQSSKPWIHETSFQTLSMIDLGSNVCILDTIWRILQHWNSEFLFHAAWCQTIICPISQMAIWVCACDWHGLHRKELQDTKSRVSLDKNQIK